MKVSVIGAGNVGAKAVYNIAEKNIADIVMVDVADGLARSKAMDFLHAAPLRGYAVRIRGTTDFAEIEGSDVVVITAGIARKPGMDRMDLLKTNVGIASQAAREISRRAPDAVVIVVTNPLDVISMVVLRETGFALRKVVGMAGVLDSTRFRYFIAEKLGVWPGDVQAMVLGGHGDDMVPLVSYTSVGGIPISQLLPAADIESLVKRTRTGGAEIVSLLKSGSAFYAPGASVAKMVEAVIKDEKRLFPASAFLRGEYGFSDVYLGVPVIMGSNGVERIIELPLTELERAALGASAESVRKGIAELGSLSGENGMRHQYEAIIVGAGGAGLYAALESSAKARTAVLSKLHPMRSHTGAAQGGIGAALGNVEEDRPEWHAFDTVKGGDYLVDQAAAVLLAEDAVRAVYDLENRGLPFNRTPDGRIDQRRFGGHTRAFGEAPVRRSCYAADRTGHMILQTLYQQCIKNGVEFFDEFHVLDVLIEGRKCRGVVALELATGEVHTFAAKAVLFATGGFGRMFRITSNAHANTGDGPAVLARRGVPLQDMEFFQFHPTGIRGMGILITEGVRGEGGILRNRSGERFMERYAPTLLDLAPRDMISRAILTEIRSGNGMRGDGRIDDWVMLDATHLGREVLEKKLPDITGFSRTYLGIDPVNAPIPIQPTAHYAMGGIPTDIDGRVIADEAGSVYEGLYAAGECACVSVHGANRLGTNSLVDLVVFGRRAGRHIASFVQQADLGALGSDPDGPARAELARLGDGAKSAPAASLREEMETVMMEKVGIFRNAADLDAAVTEVRALRGRWTEVRARDKSRSFNSDILGILELQNLLDLSLLTAVSARERTESRGAHARDDHPERDDARWLHHSLAWLGKDGGVRLGSRPVDISTWKPKPRVY